MTRPPNRIEAYHFYEETWNGYDDLATSFEWTIPEPFNGAHYCCDRWAAAEPARPALRIARDDGPTEALTYGALHRSATRLAAALAERGVGRGDRVLLHGAQRPMALAAILAAWTLGAVAVPVSTLLGPEGLGYRVDDCEAAALVVTDAAIDPVRGALARADHAPAAVLVDGEPPDGLRDGETSLAAAIEAAPADGVETAETSPDDVATVIYTSGTTGQPKGVLLPHRVLLGHLPQFVTIVCNMTVAGDDLIWTPVEWTWVASVYIRLLPALFYGVPMLAYDRGSFDADAAFGLVEREGVTILGAAPTALRMMAEVDADPYDLTGVRVVGGGGESFGEDLRSWARATFGDVAIHEGYGQTEANGLVGECEALAPHRPGTVGRAGIGRDLAVVDPATLDPVAPGEVGEFALRYADDPIASLGYLGRPAAMVERRRDGWHLTGDLGTVDTDGYFTFEGRNDEVIVSSGYRIGPDEIESQLVDHEAVAAAAVIGVPDDTRGEVPKAFVVLVDGVEPTDALAEALQAHVRERLAKYEYPREIAFVDALPTTTTGKVERAALRERERDDA